MAEDANQNFSRDVPYDPQRVAQKALRQDPSLDEDLVLRLAIEARSHLMQMRDGGSFEEDPDDPDAPALARRLLTHVSGSGASVATVVARAAAQEWRAAGG